MSKDQEKYTILKLLKKFHIGQFSEKPAEWIDKIHLQKSVTFKQRLIQGVKTRLIFSTFFPICSLIDTFSAQLSYWFLKGIASVTQDKETKKAYHKRADKFFDLSIKNLLGTIAFPFGIINPKWVSFFFVPKKTPSSYVESGGKLYMAKSELKRPEKIEEIQAILQKAIQNNKKVTVLGAGRSQGKQFLPSTSDGYIIDMHHFNEVSINKEKKTATVGAGATWGDLQIAANQQKLAVKVMQASNVFSIGGSIGTNIHGWHKAGTIGNTLRSITYIDPKGVVKKVKPQDEAFGYLLGGFGQTGVILKAKIELADNEKLVEKSVQVSSKKYFDYFKKNVENNEDVRMHLYRLSLNPGALLSEGVAVNYQITDEKDPCITPHLQKEPKRGTRTQRILFNMARRFKLFRSTYWKYEKNRLLNNETLMTTNEIMQPPISAMFNHAQSESEWLQEYFIPGKNLDQFIEELGKLLTKNQVNLLNATVRYVKQDKLSKMPYAGDGDKFAVVLCFNQSLQDNEITKTKKWVREAIDLTLSKGGTYYLPYQHFASKEQFDKSYPMAADFYKKKCENDPNQVFESGFFKDYLEKQEFNNHYQSIFESNEHKKAFGEFLDNIFPKVDKAKCFSLIEDILSYSDSPLEIYTELSKRADEMMPSMLSTPYRSYTSLSNIKKDLSEQSALLMKNHSSPINGLIEIGYPGRFVNALKSKLNIQGPVTVVNTNESVSDLLQSGFPRPYDQFIPLNDYAPLDPKNVSDKSVDLITCFIGLHHIPEQKMAAFLQSLNRTLRLGGTFLLMDHDVKDPLTHHMASLAHSVFNAATGVSIEEEINELRNFKSLKDWQDLVTKYGFRLDESLETPLIRKGDPTLNTMVRFVKVKDCTIDNTIEESLTKSSNILFMHKSKPKIQENEPVITITQKHNPSVSRCKI